MKLALGDQVTLVVGKEEICAYVQYMSNTYWSFGTISVSLKDCDLLDHEEAVFCVLGELPIRVYSEG